MKITKITIDGLFGVFNHALPLNHDVGVTIVIGENGIGKTRILEAVHAVFAEKFQYLCNLEFEALKIYFDKGVCWEISRKFATNLITIYGKKIESHANPAKIKPEKLFELSRPSRRANLKVNSWMKTKFIYEADLRNIHIKPRSNIIVEDDEALGPENFFFWNGDREEVKPPAWFYKGLEETKVRLIETQRILSPKAGKAESYGSTVKNCASELKEEISQAVKASADISSGLDSTYPNRLVEKLQANTDQSEAYSNLNQSLGILDERRKNLSAAGLVVDELNRGLVQIRENEGALTLVMELYIADSHKKLDPYKELAEKINLFMRIINKRFKHKKLEINKEHGFLFRSTRIQKGAVYAEIDAADLSSGEQHELVLFYKLIFNSSSDDLVMVDEPELSLHISWQNQFVNDLKEVAGLKKFSALIATHSPDIISENWDLMIELKGVE